MDSLIIIGGIIFIFYAIGYSCTMGWLMYKDRKESEGRRHG